jgi:predicted adenylyl cyclase CyaB
MPREIEVRFKLTPEQKEAFLLWVKKNSTFQHETHHVEYYLNNPSNSFIFENKNGFKDSEHYLRVRFDEKKGDSVCLKVFKIDQEKHTSENVDEIEYSVSSGKEALHLFSTLGYTEQLLVDKKRDVYLTNDQLFEICIDEVKSLGTFAEVELKEQVDGDIKIGFKKIYDFLRTVGIASINEQHRGYVSMLWNPTEDFGRIRILN